MHLSSSGLLKKTKKDKNTNSNINEPTTKRCWYELNEVEAHEKSGHSIFVTQSDYTATSIISIVTNG
jgi:hypothetical protein